ncbi:MAG: hypothetical protein AAF203_09595 [Pseudomonadota bacterium]
MKKIILAINVLFTLCSQSAWAYLPVQPGVQTHLSTLESLTINHGSLKGMDEGDLIIEEGTDQETIILSLRDDFCKGHEVCIAIAPKVRNIALPLTQKYVDPCGSTVYVAELDNTPVDGLYQRLQVVDNTKMVCDIFVPHMTMITYTTVSPRTRQTEVSYFGGKALELLPILF